MKGLNKTSFHNYLVFYEVNNIYKVKAEHKGHKPEKKITQI